MARFLLAVLALAAVLVALWLRRSPQPVAVEPDEMQAVQWTFPLPTQAASGGLATIGYLYPHPHQRRSDA